MQEQPRLWSTSFVILLLCNLFLLLNLQMLLSSLPAYVKNTFQASDMMASLVVTLFAFTAVFARIYAGYALQKGKLQVILLTGLAIVAIATAGYYWSSTILALLIMRVLFGIGFGLSSTVFPTMASNVLPLRKMGEGMGYFGLSMSAALAIGPFLGVFLLTNVGFSSLIALSTLIVLFIFPLLLFIKSSPAFKAKPKPSKTSVSEKVKQILNKRILYPSFLNFLLSMTYSGIVSFIVVFGQEMSISNAGIFFLLHSIAVIIIRPFAGRYFDKHGPRRIVMLGGIMAGIGLFVLSLANSVVVLLLSGLIYGIGYGMIQPSVQAWIIKEVPVEQRGLANGMFLNSLDLGVAAGAVVFGVIASFTSYSSMYQLSVLLMVLFTATFLLPFTKKHNTQQEKDFLFEKERNVK